MENTKHPPKNGGFFFIYMALEETIRAQGFRYYTQTPFEEYAITPYAQSEGDEQQRGIPEAVQRSKDYGKLYQRLTEPFRRSQTTEGKFKVFNNGDQPISPMDADPRQFEREAAEIIYDRCADFFTPEGTVDESRRQEFNNVMEIAPTLTAILTDRESHVTLAQRQHALNIVAASIDKARNPDMEIVITEGFGGSDDPFTSTRFDAYPIPAATIAEQINDMYTTRAANKLASAARNKVIAAYKESQGMQPTDQIDKGVREEITRQVQPDDTGHYSELDEEEERGVMQRFSIAEQPVRVEFVFAHNAGIAINGGKKEAKQVVARANDNKAELQQFMETYHPAVAANTVYRDDIPWDSEAAAAAYGEDAEGVPLLSFNARVMRDYMANVLRTSDDHAIQETLAILQHRGDKNGGEHGGEGAAEYAGLHGVIFGDRLNLPFTQFIYGRDENSAIRVTVGCRTERHFCAVREYLAEHANPAGYREYITQRMASAPDEEQDALAGVLTDLDTWEAQMAEQRGEYAQGGYVAAQDRPVHVIPLITDIGESRPPYYNTEFDRPAGSNIGQQIDDIDQFLGEVPVHRVVLDILTEDAMDYREPDDPHVTYLQNKIKETNTRAAIAEGVRHDLVVLQNHIGKRQVIFSGEQPEESILQVAN